MPLAAHAKNNGGGRQYHHDDTGCKEVPILVAAALRGSLGTHAGIRTSTSFAGSISLTRDLSLRRCGELPRGESKS